MSTNPSFGTPTRRVPLVSRNPGENDDHETYQYGGDGMRVRKRTTTQASNVTRTVDAIYLPGLTLRITSSGDGKTMTAVESVQEVASDAGSINARCLHWETGQPTGLTKDPLRYGTGDRNGSISLELDDQAALISREEYYRLRRHGGVDGAQPGRGGHEVRTLFGQGARCHGTV